MSVFEGLRLNYMRASYLQAEQEGRLPQWFLKQFIFWLLRLFFTLLVVFPIRLLLIVPIKLIWEYSGRKNRGINHFLVFLLVMLVYSSFLGALIGCILGLN